MFYSVTCKNPDCGKRFKIRGPLQSGVHKVGCPYCAHKNNVRVKPLEQTEMPGEDPQPGPEAKPQPSPAPKPQPSPAQASELDTPAKIQAKYKKSMEKQAAEHNAKLAAIKKEYEKRHAALKEARDRLLAEAEAKHTKAMEALKADMEAALAKRKVAEDPAGPTVEPWAPLPVSPYLIAYHFSGREKILFKVSARGHVFGAPEDLLSDLPNLPESMESLRESEVKDRVYLRSGSNILGRYDEKQLSTINIDGRYDCRMSRTSVNIEVILRPNGTLAYTATLMNSKNPVYCDDVQLMPKKKYPLSIGSSIYMGETQFVLQCE